MSRRHLAASLAGIAALAAPASGRVVDYAALTGANYAAEAANLKIAPVTPPPLPGRHAVTVDVAAGLDHDVLTLGIRCSAYKVENPVTALLRQLAAEAGTTGGSPLRIIVNTARSNQRCVEVKEYNIRCIGRVVFTGEVEVVGADGAPVRRPLGISVERDSSVGGFCEDRGRAIGIITREAGHQLLAAALAAVP